jgi:hypothetical protein
VKPQKKYRITIDVPAHLYPAQMHQLFSTIATAAHKWETQQPERTWDIDVSGRIITE